MTSRVEIDLPEGHSTLAFGELAGFVDQARNAGVSPDTSVIAVPAEQDPSILIALRVEMEELVNHPADLRINREDVKELLDLLIEIDGNDGDARSQMHVVRNCGSG